jgi:asparagine synthase (glutamine-hydrolysing)
MCGIWGLLSLKNITYDETLLYSKFNSIKSRGPDKSTYITNPNYIVGFHRLSIMDLSIQGDQPFSFSYYYNGTTNSNKYLRTIYLVVNGEIYNWEKLRTEPDIKESCQKNNYQYKSNSDCEVLLPLFLKYVVSDSYIEDNKLFETGLKEMITRLDGEFAFAIYDIHQNLTTSNTHTNLWIGRDRFGIRPLFFTQLNDYTIGFGSELKSLINLDNNNTVRQIDPRSWYYWGGDLNSENKLINYNKIYYSVGSLPLVRNPDPTDVYRMCRTLLTKSIVDRLHADREVGCLLSGGLDSSLVAAIASEELKKQNRTLKTFSIGMEGSPDVKYAKIVAEHIGSIHTNFNVPQEEWISSIRDVIRISETFDITSVRATVGQYLICKKIAETTSIKVLLIGDGSDEATGGYLYFHKAPNPMALHFETQRLLHWIHYFDVLRADRGVASNGLEARVPYLSHEFINFYFQVDPILRMPRQHTLSTGQTNIYEKYLLRKSFDKTNLLPECVLWRKKEAFSDGVSAESKSWYQIVQDMVEKEITDEQFTHLSVSYYKNYASLTGEQIAIPHTKEALYYHLIFDGFYPQQFHTIPYYWMPKWIDNATDPSARTLQIYKDVENGISEMTIDNSKANYGSISLRV